MSSVEQEKHDGDYFAAYNDVDVHEIMLRDEPRMEGYLAAVKSLAKLWKEQGVAPNSKIVLDVGAGTSILSLFCARELQPFVKAVFAVEASPMAKVAETIIKANNLDHLITVFQSAVEDVVLPEKADVIISEWMGFYLFHESMLPSVLIARNKWLKPDGLMMPSKARLWTAPIDHSGPLETLNLWKNIKGFDFSCLLPAAIQRVMVKQTLTIVQPEQLLAFPELVKEINLQTVTIEEVQTIGPKNIEFATIRSGLFHGFSLWFDVTFGLGPKSPKAPSSDSSSSSKDIEDDGDDEDEEEDEEVVLTTAPGSDDTHWKQMVVLLDHNGIPVEAGDSLISADVHLAADKAQNERFYNVSFEIQSVSSLMADDDDPFGDYDDDDEESGGRRSRFVLDLTQDPELESLVSGHSASCDCIKCNVIRGTLLSYNASSSSSDQQQQDQENGSKSSD